jgi:hypothetical protein
MQEVERAGVTTGGTRLLQLATGGTGGGGNGAGQAATAGTWNNANTW